MCKVSVLLCNYNYGNFIGEAIASVLSQSFTDFELIVVDDGSTDHSREVIETFDDPRIKTIYQENGGQASAFNAGFQVCRGEFIAFLDSDDFWFEEKLEKVLLAFGKEGVAVVQHNLKVVDDRSKDLGWIHTGVCSGVANVLELYHKEHRTGFFSTTSGVACRKSALDNVFPLDASWKICADVAFTRPMPIFGQVYTLPEILGAYRLHGNNMWMDTEPQGDVYENNQRYNRYTNSWLRKYNIEEIDMSKFNIDKKSSLGFLQRLKRRFLTVD